MRTCRFISELWRKKRSDLVKLRQSSTRYGGQPRLLPYGVSSMNQVHLFHNSVPKLSIFQRFGLSSSASSETNENGTIPSGDGPRSTEQSSDDGAKTSAALDKEAESDSVGELSMDDLVKLLGEKEELLKQKHKEMEVTEDRLLQNLAETENIMERIKREASHAKKFAIQNFAKSLLDVADNLGRASSTVNGRFAEIGTSEDPAGAVPLLKTLLEGVEMTDKQLAEVFKKFGVEKYDPVNEHFDPHRHNAVFQVPDPSKPPNTVAVVLKPGYMLYDRIIRPAEVGVTVAVDDRAED